MAVNEPMMAELDAYLDGTMPPEQRRAFEARLGADAELRRAVEQQRKIDQSIRRLMMSPAKCSTAIQSAAAPSHTMRTGPDGVAGVVRPSLLKRFAVAALLMLAVLSALWAAWSVLPLQRNPHELPQLTAAQYYDKKVRRFEPYWVCKSDQQFTDTFRGRFGQALLITAMPANISSKGIDYCHTISPKTLAVLMTADDQKIIVLVDDAGANADRTIRPRAGLHVHTRTVGKLKLTEISPIDQPRTLELFFDPDVERDKTGPGVWK
jgi:hypothetical protein